MDGTLITPSFASLYSQTEIDAIDTATILQEATK